MIRPRVFGQRQRSGLAALLGAVFAATAVGASAAPDPSKIPTGAPIPDHRGFNGKVNDVAGNVYVLAGAGGNVTVQAGDDGLLVVDNNFTVFYDQIMANIRQIADKPIKIVVNTHSHFDRNQNNANVAQAGALVFAHPNTRLAIMQQGRPPAPGAAERRPEQHRVVRADV